MKKLVKGLESAPWGNEFFNFGSRIFHPLLDVLRQSVMGLLSSQGCLIPLLQLCTAPVYTALYLVQVYLASTVKMNM